MNAQSFAALRVVDVADGLLFGGTVGAGFAAFESAGYAFRRGLGELTIQTLSLGAAQLESVFESIWVRSLLTPGGHVAWMAIFSFIQDGLQQIRSAQEKAQTERKPLSKKAAAR